MQRHGGRGAVLAEHGPLTEYRKHEPEPHPLRQRDRVPVTVVPGHFRLEALDLLGEVVVDEGAGLRTVWTRLPRLGHAVFSFPASWRRKSTACRTAWTWVDSGSAVRTSTCSPVAGSVTSSPGSARFISFISGSTAIETWASVPAGVSPPATSKIGICRRCQQIQRSSREPGY